MYGKAPSKENGHSFLTCAIAYRLQKRPYGGVKPETRRLLQRVSARLEMHRGALAIQVASGAARLLYPIGLIVRDEEGIDPDDRIDFVTVLVVSGVPEADSGNAGVVVIPGSAHAYTLHLSEFGEFGMARNLVALDDNYPLDRGLLGFVAGVDRSVFFRDRRASRDRQDRNDERQAFHGTIS